MKKISLWAKHHPWPARLSIVALYIILNASGISLGKLLSASGFHLPSFTWSLLCLLLFSAMLLYPYKESKRIWGSSKFYVRQKTADLVLLLASFGMIVFLANQDTTLLTSQFVQASIIMEKEFPVKDSSTRTYKTLNEFGASMRDENGQKLKWKERKKLLKQQISAINKAEGMSEADRSLLIVLSILLAALALAGVAALACNLSCSGSEAAAIVVAIGGTALVIFLLVRAIRSINRKNKKQLEAPPPKEPGTAA